MKSVFTLRKVAEIIFLAPANASFGWPPETFCAVTVRPTLDIGTVTEANSQNIYISTVTLKLLCLHLVAAQRRHFSEKYVSEGIFYWIFASFSDPPAHFSRLRRSFPSTAPSRPRNHLDLLKYKQIS
jgi:hypothetical protein